jgi:S1-C subfamily serine protease
MKKSPTVTLMVIVFVFSSMLGCRLPDVLLVPPTATPTSSPTPTPPSPATLPASAAPVNELEAQIESVYDQAGGAVVNVTSISYAYDFFLRPVPQEGTGSGFFYDAEGHIVTNYHVVENAEELTVTLDDGRSYPATVIGVDPTNDLAVIHIEAEQLPPPIPLGDSDVLRVGQFVIAIGNPFGQVGTLTVGVISALGRVIESPDGRFIGEAIQTDAAINPGNSGGPLLNLRGRLIGVNSQIISPSRASAGIGFAVPANTVQRVIPLLIAHGRYPHPWLGVDYLPLTPNWVEAFRRAELTMPDEGLLVLQVAPNGPADRADLRGGDRVIRLGNVRVPVGGDVIIAIDGQPMTNAKEFIAYLETQTMVGDTVQVTFIRDGEEQIVSATLDERQ